MTYPSEDCDIHSMFWPSSHVDSKCINNCPLANDEFIEKANQFTMNLARKACQKLGLSESSVVGKCLSGHLKYALIHFDFEISKLMIDFGI